MRSLILLLAAGALALSPACKTKNDTPVDQKSKKNPGAQAPAPPSGAKTAAGAKPKAAKPAAGAYGAAAFLPPTTHGVFAVSDPTGLYQKHIEKALKAIPDVAKVMKEMSEGSTKFLGVDVTDPKNLSSLGVNPNGEFSVALVSEVGMVWTFAIPLSKPETFIKKTGDAFKIVKGPAWAKQGEGQVLAMGGEGMAVVRGNFAFLIVADRSRAPIKKIAETIATQKAGAGLASTKQFAADTAAAKGGNMRGWFHLGPVIDTVVGRAERAATAPYTMNKWDAEALEKAKAKDDKKAIERIMARVEDDKKWRAKYKKRDAAAYGMLAATMGGIESMTGMGTLDGPGLDGTMKVKLRKDRLLAKLVKPGKGVAATVKGLRITPRFLLHATLDKASTKELIEMMMAAEGGSWERLKTELQKGAGIDLDSEIWAPLTGEVGFGMTIDTSDPKKLRGEKAMGGGLALRADGAKFKALMGKLAEKGLLKKVEGADSEWTFPLPFGPTVYVAIKGDWVSASTLKDFAADIAGDGANSFAGKLSAPAKRTLNTKGAGAVFSFSQVIGTMMLFAMGMSSPPMMGAPGKLDDAKKKKWDELQAQLKKAHALEEDMRYLDAMAALEAARLAGGLTLAATPKDGSWDVVGGYFVGAESVSAMVTAMGKLLTDTRTKRDAKQKEMDAIVQKVNALAKELGIDPGFMGGRRALGGPVAVKEAVTVEAKEPAKKGDAKEGATPVKGEPTEKKVDEKKAGTSEAQKAPAAKEKKAEPKKGK